jgi:heptosyltransferase-2
VKNRTPNKLAKKWKDPRTILVRAPNWIGDQVLAFPFFYHLRRAYPQAHIATVCVPWVSDLQFKTLVDEVIMLERPRPGAGGWEKFKQLDRQARSIGERREWDLGISLPNSFSSAWLLYRAKAKQRRGYRFEGRGLLLNDGILLPDESFGIHHRAQAYQDLLPESVRVARDVKEFWGVLPENELDEKIPGEQDSFDADRYWPSPRVPPPKELYWVLAPGATADSRRWPVDYFINLAKQIAAATNLRGVIVGGPKEAPLAERLCQFEELRLVDYTARGPVAGLVDVFRGAEFTVTNESGLAHVASFCGSFTQIICGAADPRRTKPIGPGLVQVSLNSVECWPCEKNTCFQPLDKQVQCLKGIKSETVWEEIRRGLRKVAR